jgi:hypothetical protein
MLSIYGLIAMLPLAARADAQESRFSIDLRGAYGMPFGQFENNVDNDFGFGAGAVFTFTPSAGVYAGWARDSFGCANVLCADDSQVHVSGFEVGAKFILPTQMVATPWLKAGLIAHRAEFDGDVVHFESDRTYGFQGAIGLDYPLGRVISVSPALRVNVLDLDEDLLGAPEIRSVSLDIGAHIHFPGS